MDWKLVAGDCVEAMSRMPGDSVDAVVTDPPYSWGFMDQSWDKHTGGDDSGFGYWFAGFVDGEGCFRVQRHVRGTFSCAFSIHLRRDDRAILESIAKFMGVGTIYDVDDHRTHPMSRYVVQSKADCLRVVEVFTRYPLRAKKLRDFLRWSEAVVEWNSMQRGHRWSGRADWSRMEALKASVENARQYKDPPWSGHPYQDWTREWMEQAFRVLKPGGHMVVFGGARTYHRVASAAEDAGFEIRDQLQWLYGSGFPKSRNVSKDFDKAAEAEREVVGRYIHSMRSRKTANVYDGGTGRSGVLKRQHDLTVPATDIAKQWEGWGTALKPANEPILLARKPLSERNLAENVRRWGTGCLNIDGCRIGWDGPPPKIGTPGWGGPHEKLSAAPDQQGETVERTPPSPAGRWPANVLLTHHPLCSKVGERRVEARVINRFTDGAKPFGGGAGHGYETLETSPDGMETVEVWACVPECPVRILDSQSGRLKSGYAKVLRRRAGENWSGGWSGGDGENATYGDSGGASRFFYVSKATTSERNAGLHGAVEPRAMDEQHRKPRTEPGLNDPRRYGAHRRLNYHPTVKPVALMRYLCRLVTPPGGLVLDPFVGSGSTGIAALAEGFNFTGIDLNPDYIGIADARIRHWQERPEAEPGEEPFAGIPPEEGTQTKLGFEET